MAKFYTVLLFIIPFSLFAQSRTGAIHYGEVQSMGMGGAVGPDYNALLLFDNKRSLYITRQDSLEGGPVREQSSFEHANGNRTSVTVVTNKQGFRYYNDLQDQQFYSRDIGFSYVKEKTPKIDWKISSETKAIGPHQAYKATGDFRGRTYTAWFTTDIPLPYGPWKLQGLPGIILEAYDTHKEIYWYFKTLEYPTQQEYLLKPIHNQDSWTSHQEFARSLFEAWKNAQDGGVMAAESIGASGGGREADMLHSYLEDFSDQEN